MKALWHLDAQTSAIQHVKPAPSPADTLHIKSQYSLISMGTELLVAKGMVPPELYTSMRVPYMQGEFLLPVKYGYSLVGQSPEGTLYHLMHPHQDHCLVDPDQCEEIPQGIPPKRATLASNLGTALTGIWDGDVKPGERIAIVGFGMIGSLIARIARSIPGTQVVVIDTQEHRRAIAASMGHVVMEDPHQVVAPFDIAYHTSATATGLQTAIDLVGMEGRVVEMSWYGNMPASLHLGGEFHILRKRIISSQVSHIPSSMRARWDVRRRRQVVFDLLHDPAFDQHITHEVTLEEAALLFSQWRDTMPEGLGYCIRY